MPESELSLKIPHLECDSLLALAWREAGSAHFQGAASCALEFPQLSPFPKGIEALRKLRSVFCGRGSSFVSCPHPLRSCQGGQRTTSAHRAAWLCFKRASSTSGFPA